MGKVSSPKRIPGQGRGNQAPSAANRKRKVTKDENGKEVTYEQRFKARQQQASPIQPAQEAHRGPHHRGKGISREAWKNEMNKPAIRRRK